MSIIDFQQKHGGATCWRTYGTWSAEPSCEKLKYVTHCRNCDVFENAARQSWENKKKAKIETDVSVFSIEDLIEKEKSAGDHSALPFRMGHHCLAVPSKSIISITDNVSSHSIPYNKNPVLKGLVAINNEVYTLVNFAHLLGLQSDKGKADPRIRRYKRVLVLNLMASKIAFYADEVYQIHRYFEKLVMNPVGEERSLSKLTGGILENLGEWESDCCLLDLNALEKHFNQEISL